MTLALRATALFSFLMAMMAGRAGLRLAEMAVAVLLLVLSYVPRRSAGAEIALLLGLAVVLVGTVVFFAVSGS